MVLVKLVEIKVKEKEIVVVLMEVGDLKAIVWNQEIKWKKVGLLPLGIFLKAKREEVKKKKIHIN